MITTAIVFTNEEKQARLPLHFSPSIFFLMQTRKKAYFFVLSDTYYRFKKSAAHPNMEKNVA